MKANRESRTFESRPDRPPSGYQGFEADNSLHLLTADFFIDLHRLLTPGGKLTIFSDNGRYCRALAALLGKLTSPSAAGSKPQPLLVSEELGGGSSAPSFELIGRVKLYLGVPGVECGHLQSESSYFDRLWEYRQGEETERFYMVLHRPED